MTNYTYEYDENTLLIGEIIEQDESFDHAFGTEKRVSHEVENFSIIVYINNIDYDVTESIKENSPKCYEGFKEDFITKYLSI